MLAVAGLHPADLENPESRIPLETLSALWRWAVRLTGDARLGLHLGAQLPMGSLGVVDYIATNGATLRDCLEQIVRYARLLNDKLEYRLEEHGDWVHFCENWSAAILVEPPHGTDMLFAALIAKMRQLRPDFTPHEVRLAHDADEEGRQDYRRVFGCGVLFGAKSDEIVFRRDALETPVLRSDGNLRSLLTRVADDQLREIPELGSVDRRLGQLMEAALLAGETVELENLAHKMHLTPRTLQRQLAVLPSSYQAVLETTRKRLAHNLLLHSEFNVAEVAHRLGFSETSSFVRSFKRWYGMTPGQYRRQPEP